MHGRWKWDFKS